MEEKSWYDMARAKLDGELNKGSFGRYGEIMKQGVHDALLTFCKQEEEFAQAVVQGGSFKDCMKAVAECVRGNGISDMEAYGAAVRFYFPGAELRAEMQIDLAGKAGESGTTEADRSLLIDLSDFF